MKFIQMCSTDDMVCMRETPAPTCGVACEGIYADVTKRQLKHQLHKYFLSFREVNNKEEQNDKEKLMIMRTEYERYKDLWGLNLHYSHTAGPTQNYSEHNLTFAKTYHLLISCKREFGASNGAHIL